jgi:uncharacterized protein (TIGR00369 family)
MGIAETIADLKARGDLAALPAAIPYAQFLGIDVEIVDERLVGRMRYHDDLVGNPALPALHGGTLGALLESTAIFQLLWEADSVVLPKTISLTIDYLRSARPVDTFASGIITKRGRRVVNVRAEAWQDDPARPVAMAHAHFLVM